MVTAEWIEQRRAAIATSSDLMALQAHLTARARRVLTSPPRIPEHKALLSMDGGVCAADGTVLAFDPWSPSEHRCPHCGTLSRGERHDRSWARFQHLWLAERAAQLATLGAVAGDADAARWARELLTAYAERYLRYPNRDNILGPSRLFFSTYLESIWVLNYLAAATLLRESGTIDDATARGVSQVADEAANLIGEFDEGFSNRQTWNDAALAAIAVWFEDEELAHRAIAGPTGLVPHLRGYRDDGMWYEGENYHLFAIRGLVTGAGWARLAGVDFFAEQELRVALLRALLAPATSALPDLTFPARKDARFGVSLAQPAFVEVWEVAAAMAAYADGGDVPADLAAWLAALRTATPGPTQTFDSYLHDAGIRDEPAPAAPRRTLSWWALLEMEPEPPEAEPWRPTTRLLESQGLAVLRRESRYISVECGPIGGGHGHPDRLHLTLHADGVHWLPDFGVGSYVSPDLGWYRSPMAHNAPSLDGGVGARVNASCERFDTDGDWAWVRGRAGDATRTVVAGPRYMIDVVEVYGSDERTVELPWHFRGSATARTAGRWEPAELGTPFVSDVERFVPDDPAAPVVLDHATDQARLTSWFFLSGEVIRTVGPGRPGWVERVPFFVLRARGRNIRYLTILEPHGDTAVVRRVVVQGDVIEIETEHGIERHRQDDAAWTVDRGGETVRLAGRVNPEPPLRPFIDLAPRRPVTGTAFLVDETPALDGTLAGFDAPGALHINVEDQYRRSEEPYPGPEEFSAQVYAVWDQQALYLAVDIAKAEPLTFRAAGAPPLLLDNEVDDIHSDGLQVYVRAGEELEAVTHGYLVVPEQDDGLRVTSAGASEGEPERVHGSWHATDRGYCVTLAVPWPEAYQAHVGSRIGFDLLVNEARPGRVRRAGQLVWSGGNGWIWLRGDRQNPRDFGTLELLG